MNTHTHPIDDPHLDLEVLIGRIVDGEATEDDRQRFELLAAREPEHWRRLAARQQDMLMLVERVDEATQAAERIELPLRAWAPAHARWSGLRSLATYSGWAAALALAAFWATSGLVPENVGGPAAPVVEQVTLSPNQHLRQYLTAPYVLGEMQPTLLEVEELPDGRLAVSFLRRIVEVAFCDSVEDLPIDEEGNFASNPEALRETADMTQTPNSAGE